MNGSIEDCKARCDIEERCTSFDFYKGQNKCDISFAPADTKLKTTYAGNPYDNYKKIIPDEFEMVTLKNPTMNKPYGRGYEADKVLNGGTAITKQGKGNWWNAQFDGRWMINTVRV